MGRGIEIARLNAPEHAAWIEEFKEELLIVFLRRLGGQVSIPVTEVDATEGLALSFSVTDGVFNFQLTTRDGKPVEVW